MAEPFPVDGYSMPFLIATRRVVSACARRIRLSISCRESPPPYARHLKQFLDLKSVNCVLDVGAFGGGFASVLRSSGFEGTIISFEPVPSSNVLLQQHMARHDTISIQLRRLDEVLPACWQTFHASQITPEFDVLFSRYDGSLTGH